MLPFSLTERISATINSKPLLKVELSLSKKGKGKVNALSSDTPALLLPSTSKTQMRLIMVAKPPQSFSASLKYGIIPEIGLLIIFASLRQRMNS